MGKWSEVSDQELSAEVLRLAYSVHSALGPGLLESVYQTCLAFELREAGMEIEVEKPVPVVYRDRVMIEVGFRVDSLVENRLVLELKSTDAIHDNFVATVLSYLQFSKVKYGLILNFGEKQLKNGIKRLAK